MGLEREGRVVRAVVFDIGGVLEITPSTGWRRRWSEHLGLSSERFGELLHPAARAGSLGTITLEQYESELGSVLGLDAAQTAAFMADVWEEYLGSANTELIDYFTGLRRRVRTGILSNSFVGAREREQALYGFEDRCEVVIYSHEEGMSKPDPAFYALVCDRLDVSPDEVVFLDDTPRCVEGARAVGMQAVLYRDNEQAIAAIEERLAAAGSGCPSNDPAVGIEPTEPRG